MVGRSWKEGTQCAQCGIPPGRRAHHIVMQGHMPLCKVQLEVQCHSFRIKALKRRHAVDGDYTAERGRQARVRNYCIPDSRSIPGSLQADAAIHKCKTAQSDL